MVLLEQMLQLRRGATASVQQFLSGDALATRQSVQYWLDLSQLAADLVAVTAPLEQTVAVAVCVRVHDAVLAALGRMALSTSAPHTVPADLALVLVHVSKALMMADVVSYMDSSAVDAVRFVLLICLCDKRFNCHDEQAYAACVAAGKEAQSHGLFPAAVNAFERTVTLATHPARQPALPQAQVMALRDLLVGLDAACETMFVRSFIIFYWQF